jgi:predicted glycosyltransferase
LLRIALFTHDTFGLGHVRRCVRLMRALAAAEPRAALLLVTGSPAGHALNDLPATADYVKVPTVVKTGAKGNQPPHLPLPPAERAALRTDLIRSAILGFAPDVLIVDNFPLGSQGELLPTLRALRATHTRTVLGLRDVLDAPEPVREDWERQGIYDVLDRYYDRILIYGMPEILDVANAYALPNTVAQKLYYCGYVTDAAPIAGARETTSPLPGSPPRLLATGGGGGDALPLLELFLESLKLLPETSATVVAGPLMGASDRDRLRALSSQCNGVQLVDHTPDLHRFLATADVVVSMCGYNSAAEIAALGTPAIVVPRTWRYGEHRNRTSTSVEWEQLIRARALASLGLVQMLEPEAVTPAALAQAIREAMIRPRNPSGNGINLNGLASATAHILKLARAEARS